MRTTVCAIATSVFAGVALAGHVAVPNKRQLDFMVSNRAACLLWALSSRPILS
eukprot:SAG31_NODE_38754_length_293_cov_1.335052_1_plen_52_part_10